MLTVFAMAATSLPRPGFSGCLLSHDEPPQVNFELRYDYQLML